MEGWKVEVQGHSLDLLAHFLPMIGWLRVSPFTEKHAQQGSGLVLLAARVLAKTWLALIGLLKVSVGRRGRALLRRQKTFVRPTGTPSPQISTLRSKKQTVKGSTSFNHQKMPRPVEVAMDISGEMDDNCQQQPEIDDEPEDEQSDLTILDPNGSPNAPT